MRRSESSASPDGRSCKGWRQTRLGVLSLTQDEKVPAPRPGPRKEVVTENMSQGGGYIFEKI